MKQNVIMQLELLVQRYPELVCCKQEIEQAFHIISSCYENGGKLILAGNGGSCADAEHIVGELMKGFKRPRPLSNEMTAKLTAVDTERGAVLAAKLQQGLPAIALSSHPSLNTAFMNDVNGNLIYAQQLSVLGNAGDVFIGISTSGNAKNIYDAAVVAKANEMKVIALSGKDGGKLKKIADVSLIMPNNETYQIQELHLPVYHCLCLMLEEHFFG